MTNFASIMSDAMQVKSMNLAQDARRGGTIRVWNWLNVRVSRR